MSRLELLRVFKLSLAMLMLVAMVCTGHASGFRIEDCYYESVDSATLDSCLNAAVSADRVIRWGWGISIACITLMGVGELLNQWPAFWRSHGRLYRCFRFVQYGILVVGAIATVAWFAYWVTLS